MVYVMSDLHGKCDEYHKMLEKINFSEQDTLYILGDICDRGPDAASIYLDIMSRDNILCIKGNHEKMLLEALPSWYGFLKKFTDKSQFKERSARIWTSNGGDATRHSLRCHDNDTVADIYKFISSMPYYREITVGEKEYLLVHAGLGDFSPEKPMEEYPPDDLVWYSPDFDETFWKDKEKYLIVGHTPTFLFMPSDYGKIYHGDGDVIAIDCGAVYSQYGGRLGCLCLDTMDEYYV